MNEPTTEAGRKMLYDMGLDDPIVGKHRQALAVRRILAIEQEAAAAERAKTAALLRVAEIMRRHTHHHNTAITFYAGPEPEHDCHLCRALVDAGVLTLGGIGAGTRAAIKEASDE